MQCRFTIRFVLLACCLFLGRPACIAQQAGLRSPGYDDYDSRTWSARPAGATAAALSPIPPPSTGTNLYSLDGPLTGARSSDPESVARSFLSGRIGSFVVSKVSTIELPLVSRYESRAAGLTHLVFRPEFQGIPYFDSGIQVHLDGEGRIWRVNQSCPATRPLELTTPASAEAAITSALALLAPETEPMTELVLREIVPETGPARQVVFQEDSLAEPIRASLVWFPSRETAVLAWQLHLYFGGDRAYLVVTGADRGEVLFSRNLTQASSPQGKVFGAPDVAHPGEGGQSDEPLTGWPAVDGVCPSGIYPAQFRAGPLLNRCWVQATETQGNNVDACLDLNGNNLCDGRATDSNTHFLFAFTNSYDLANDPVTDRAAALANAFYWTNALHDWLYGLGFDEAAGNFQTDNYGRGGAAADALKLDVQDAGASNNANFLTPPDGIAPRMQLGLFAGLRRDSAFDGDVITHEYAHGLTNRLIGGPLSVIGLYRWHSGALAEGWSDSYAATFTNDPVIGEYVSRNPATGIRTVAYDSSPYTFGQFGTLFSKAIPGASLVLNLPQVHRDGEIWATVLWQLRQALGQAAFENALTTGLTLTPNRPSMLDARDAILQAAISLGVGGSNACGVWTAFAARGFGASAALNPKQNEQPNDTALSVYEAFDLPPACGGTPLMPVDNRLDDDMEGGDNGWTATGLWRRTNRRAASGVFSWWFGQEATGTYNTGARAFGTLTSPSIDLTGVSNAVVEWDQVLRTEGFGQAINLGSGNAAAYLNADAGRLLISVDGGSWVTLSHLAHNNSGGGFEPHKVNISRFAGGSVRIRFDIDTIDAVNNGLEGWFIDNVRVSRLSASPSQLLVSPLGLTFSGVAGALSPGSQTINISNGSGEALGWSANVSQGNSWLTLSSPAGVAPSTVAVSLDSSGLPAGTHLGVIEIDAAGAADSPATVNVTLTLSAPALPAALWSFEESASGPGVTVTDSFGGHHGTTKGFGSVPSPGASGFARVFNGSTDCVQIPASSDLTPTTFTARAWVKLHSYPSSFGVILAAFGGGNSRGWYLGVKSSGEVIFMGASPPNSSPWLVSSAKLNLKQWHSVSVTVDRLSGDVAIYIDGARDRTARFPAIVDDATVPVTIGRASWYDGYYLNAAIDEIEIFPALRTAADIASRYALFSPPPLPANLSTVAEWNFQSGAADVSGNGHGGTLNGTATVTGVSGNGRRFDGVSDVATVPGSVDFTPSSFTVRAWVELLSAPGDWGAVVANFGGAFDGWYLGVNSDGRVLFAAGSLPSSLPIVVSASAVSLNRWHHITAAYHGQTRRVTLYIDGVQDTVAYVAGLTPQAGGTLAMGKASWAQDHFLHFDLDEVRLDPTVWTPVQTQSDFNSFFPDQALDPVAIWKFDDAGAGPGTSLADSSGNGHDATTQGLGAESVSGVVGPARSFAGRPDYAWLSPHAELSTASFSFATWVKVDTYPGNWGVIASTYGGDFKGWYVGVFNDGRVIFSVSGLPSSNPWLLSASSLQPGQWHYVAVTLEGASRRGRIYIDGVLDRTAVYPAFTPQTSTQPTLGRASWVDSYYLNCTLDEARLYPGELASGEVLALFNSFPAPPPPAAPQPVAHWAFGETGVGPGTVLADGTGNGHDAVTAGTGTVPATGINGSGRHFTGFPDYAYLTPHAELSSTDFSLTSWVKIDALPSKWGVIYSNYGGDFQGWYAGIHTDGRVIFSVSGLPSSNPWLLSTSSLTPGQWHHIAVTFDGSDRRGRIYIDGLLDRSAVFPAFDQQSVIQPLIGRASWVDSYYLKFLVDEMKLYGQELSPSEVLADMAGVP